MPSKPPRHAVIVGAGIAGLATAIRLKTKGYAVEVFESAHQPGGKMGIMEMNGFRFDTGPSLFTLPKLVDEVIADAGLIPGNYLKYTKHPTACRYFWEDGTRLFAEGTPNEFAKKASEVLGDAPENIQKYFVEAGKMYDLTKGVFLQRSLHRWQTYFTRVVWRAIPKLPTLGLFSTLHERNAKRFSGSPKLIQLFDRFATYNGSSPYLTPGIMQMICHLEHNIGTYYPEGGMHSIARALHRAGEDLGVKYHFGLPVKTIAVKNGCASGVVVGEKFHAADVVVSNVDVRSTYKHLLPQLKMPKNVQRQKPSSSAIIFYWGIRGQFSELDLHNIFFTENYEAEFTSIFTVKDLYEDPTVYLNITSKLSPQDAPNGCENWFVMVNAPADEGQDWETLVALTRKRVLEKLGRMLGKDISAMITVEDVLTPPKIERQTASQGGALYGSSSNERMAAFLRHANFSRKIPGLFFCGGSVHPGGGIPLCLLSAKITSELISI
ncbi:MAG: phytoene desaturase [Cryomorphaceae bacterium]|nr:phytoene desaturase [Cryomorphaceae bacterium]